MKVSITETIGAPREEVFAAFTDLEHCAEHIDAIVKCEVLTDGPVGVGTRFRETRVMFKREATEEMEITKFDPPSSYTVEAESCGAHYSTIFRFEPEGAGTRVECEFGAQPVTFMAKLMSPLSCMMAGTLRKCLTQDMEQIKARVEAAGDGGSTLGSGQPPG